MRKSGADIAGVSGSCADRNSDILGDSKADFRLRTAVDGIWNCSALTPKRSTWTPFLDFSGECASRKFKILVFSQNFASKNGKTFFRVMKIINFQIQLRTDFLMIL